MYERNKIIGIVLLILAAMTAVSSLVLASFIVPDHWEDTDMHVQSRTMLLIVLAFVYVVLGVVSFFSMRNPFGIYRKNRTYPTGRRVSLGKYKSQQIRMRVNGRKQWVDTRRLQDPEGYAFITLGTTMLGVTLTILSLCILRFLPAWTFLWQMISLGIFIVMLFVVNFFCKQHYVVVDDNSEQYH